MRKLITPNLITYFRFVLSTVGIVMLVSFQGFWLRLAAFLVLFAAALSDMLDGWLARRRGQITDEGKILDPIADKFFTLGVMGVYSYLKVYSIIWVLLVAFREILVTVVRIHLLKKGQVIAAESLGKLKTIMQSVSLLVSCFYLFARDHLVSMNSGVKILKELLFAGNYLFLWIAVFLTLLSGITFFLNLKPAHPSQMGK